MRREERLAKSNRGRDWTPVIYSAIFGFLVVGSVGLLIYAQNAPAPKRIQPASGSAQLVGERVPIEPANHVALPNAGRYASDPPASGQHYSMRGQAPAGWGYYDQALPPEDWLHNLEHGGVVILYNCLPAPTAAGTTLVEGGQSTCPDDQRLINEFVSGAPQDAVFHEVKIVATQYAIPGHRFAMLAWGWRMFMDAWDTGQAERFYEAHVDNGPEGLP